MANKAIYKYSIRDRFDDRYLTMFFEYRGVEYQITRALSWTDCSSDYLRGGSMSEYAQHKEAQALIDAKLDNPAPEKAPEIRKGPSEAEIALDKLFDYINGNENAFDE